MMNLNLKQTIETMIVDYKRNQETIQIIMNNTNKYEYTQKEIQSITNLLANLRGGQWFDKFFYLIDTMPFDELNNIGTAMLCEYMDEIDL